MYMYNWHEKVWSYSEKDRIDSESYECIKMALAFDILLRDFHLIACFVLFFLIFWIFFASFYLFFDEIASR